LNANTCATESTGIFYLDNAGSIDLQERIACAICFEPEKIADAARSCAACVSCHDPVRVLNFPCSSVDSVAIQPGAGAAARPPGCSMNSVCVG